MIIFLLYLLFTESKIIIRKLEYKELSFFLLHYFEYLSCLFTIKENIKIKKEEET